MGMRALKHKWLMLIPTVVLLLSVGVLVNNYVQTGEWFLRSIELKGGTAITVETVGDVDSRAVEAALSESFGSLSVREFSGFAGSGLSIEVGSDVDSDRVLLALESLGIETTGVSIQTIGSSLGSAFWQQTQLAIVTAFVMMGVIVFLIFRVVVPSLNVIFAAVADIVTTLAIMQLLNIELSLASLAALLMLIGYSVDTDILLATKVLRGGEADEGFSSAIKTGLTMTLTTLGAVTALLLFSLSPVLNQIAAVLAIGLVVDILNTWVQNAGVLRWYLERKGLSHA